MPFLLKSEDNDAGLYSIQSCLGIEFGIWKQVYEDFSFLVNS